MRKSIIPYPKTQQKKNVRRIFSSARIPPPYPPPIPASPLAPNPFPQVRRILCSSELLSKVVILPNDVMRHLQVVGALVLTHRGREERREGGELDRMNRMYGIETTVGCIARGGRGVPPGHPSHRRRGMLQTGVLCDLCAACGESPRNRDYPTMRKKLAMGRPLWYSVA